ncbi:hypothetical protein C8J57DRAFT_1530152 [Mycena rebaudengoi]|nr:hypothetical protein C8J57DRAFT_1530152 [Mycena rebaudengoi]
MGNWVVDVALALAGTGERSAPVHEWLAGAAEDVLGADVLPAQRNALHSSLRAAVPPILSSVAAVLPPQHRQQDDPAALPAALACLSAWLPTHALSPQDLAPLVPRLIASLLERAGTLHSAAGFGGRGRGAALHLDASGTAA